MTKKGAEHSRNIKDMAKQMHEQDFQLSMNDVQMKFECHQRAVAATSQFEKVGEIERTTPAPTAAQVAYAKELYEWVTEVFNTEEFVPAAASPLEVV